MEFCQLGDLSYFIKKRDTLGRHEATKEMVEKYPNPPAGGLNEVIVRHFLKQLASALEFLRTRNFIHRDVKPQNLLLDPSPVFYARAKPESVPYAAHDQSLIPTVGVQSLPTLKIADFGFARSLPSTSLAETLCGSPLYMAPEILRYEKYDAKADLWSVGTVLYEMMTGKPPFRAANHVELLRRIERGEDKIKFPDDVVISDSMKKLIRGLLNRHPVERMGFSDFFNSTVIKDQIPGLVGDDRPMELPSPGSKEGILPKKILTERENIAQNDQRGGSGILARPGSAGGPPTPTQRVDHRRPQIMTTRTDIVPRRPSSGTPPPPAFSKPRNHGHQHETSNITGSNDIKQKSQTSRPNAISRATAPAGHDLHSITSNNAISAATKRQPDRNTPSPRSLNSGERQPQQQRGLLSTHDRTSQEVKEAQERAAQDVAFERDYVVVEKRAVEVNALADELASSPRIHGTAQTQPDTNRGTMLRRATTQGASPSAAGAQVTPSRAIQIVSGKRPDHVHHRSNSYERKIRDQTSANSVLTKAINLAGGRLINMGFSPPLGMGRGGPSPPSYNPFPAYPTNKGSLVMIEDKPKSGIPADDDSRAVFIIEESATRSDVVYGFAEVKYKQLIPLAPSLDHGLGLQQAGIPEGVQVEVGKTEDDGLTIDAIVTLSEEALVLYVKALSLLAQSMDIAGAWWARKNRGDVIEQSSSPRTHPSSSSGVASGNRINNVVQWVRSRFNEVLEKAEFVRLKLIESQKQLPLDHQSHPNNHPSTSNSALSMGTSADNVIISSGVTAEKLMYDRALEMSRSAAVNELVGEDLPGCEIAYITAIRMLEAILDDDEESVPNQPSSPDKESNVTAAEDYTVNAVESEDRKVVTKRKPFRLSLFCTTREPSLITCESVVLSIRTRLAALRKKMQVLAKRASSAPKSSTPLKAPVPDGVITGRLQPNRKESPGS